MLAQAGINIRCWQHVAHDEAYLQGVACTAPGLRAARAPHHLLILCVEVQAPVVLRTRSGQRWSCRVQNNYSRVFLLTRLKPVE